MAKVLDNNDWFKFLATIVAVFGPGVFVAWTARRELPQLGWRLISALVACWAIGFPGVYLYSVFGYNLSPLSSAIGGGLYGLICGWITAVLLRRALERTRPVVLHEGAAGP